MKPGTRTLSGRWQQVASLSAAIWLASAAPASATRFSGAQSVYVADSVEIDDDLFAFGRNATINGHIRGDLFTFAMSATLDGQSDGSATAFVYDFKMSGNCRSSVRVFARRTDVDGHIERNLMAFGETVALSRQGWVEKDVHVGAGTLLVQGRVGGNLRGGADQVYISGQIDGDVKIESDNIVIQPTAIIGGSFQSIGEKEPKIEPGAQILGEISHKLPKEKRESSRYGPGDFIGDLLSFLALAATGGVLLALFGGFAREVTTRVRAQWLKSLGLGFVFLVCLPIAAVILLVTVIGIPLGLVLVIGWLLLFYLAKVFGGMVVGEWVLTRSRGGRTAAPFWSMTLGLLIIILILKIPYVWLVVKLALLMLTFGGFFLTVAARHAFARQAQA